MVYNIGNMSVEFIDEEYNSKLYKRDLKGKKKKKDSEFATLMVNKGVAKDKEKAKKFLIAMSIVFFTLSIIFFLFRESIFTDLRARLYPPEDNTTTPTDNVQN